MRFCFLTSASVIIALFVTATLAFAEMSIGASVAIGTVAWLILQIATLFISADIKFKVVDKEEFDKINTAEEDKNNEK